MKWHRQSSGSFYCPFLPFFPCWFGLLSHGKLCLETKHKQVVTCYFRIWHGTAADLGSKLWLDRGGNGSKGSLNLRKSELYFQFGWLTDGPTFALFILLSAITGSKEGGVAKGEKETKKNKSTLGRIIWHHAGWRTFNWQHNLVKCFTDLPDYFIIAYLWDLTHERNVRVILASCGVLVQRSVKCRSFVLLWNLEHPEEAVARIWKWYLFWKMFKLLHRLQNTMVLNHEFFFFFLHSMRWILCCNIHAKDLWNELFEKQFYMIDNFPASICSVSV